MSRVLVLGDVMEDVVVRPAGPIRHGTDQRATIRLHTGGAGINQAAWLAHCGVAVRLLACVGGDDRGGLMTRLTALGIEPVLIGHPDLPTGRLIALIDADGERSFLTDRGANDGLALDDVAPEILDDIGHLHVSGYAVVGPQTRETVRQLLHRARERGIAISFDPGSAGFVAEIGAERLLGWIGSVDLCVTNEAEAAALTGHSEADAQMATLCDPFALVVLKRGAAGARARHRDGRTWSVAAPAVTVIDTIGAGDAFLAGFLASSFRRETVDSSLRQAIALGTRCVTTAGGLPS